VTSASTRTLFQSTPRLGRPKDYEQLHSQLRFQSSPRVGGDVERWRRYLLGRGFNPRPRERRPEFNNWQVQGNQFQSTPHAGGETIDVDAGRLQMNQCSVQRAACQMLQRA
jgi:hypothetical protein